MRPEDRCIVLYDAALEVFADGGYGRATLNDIAKRAGVTKGCLYHHFGSKEALLLSLIRERASPPCDEAKEELSAATSREEAIAIFVRVMWQHFQRPGQLELTTLAFVELPKNPEIARTLFDEVVAFGRQFLQEVIQNIPRQRPLTNEEITAMATVIPSLIMGAALGHQLFADVDRMSPVLVEQTIAGILTRGV